jgi:hypothetical protein
LQLSFQEESLHVEKVKISLSMIHKGKILACHSKNFQEVKDLDAEISWILPVESVFFLESMGLRRIRIKRAWSPWPALVIEGGNGCEERE